METLKKTSSESEPNYYGSFTAGFPSKKEIPRLALKILLLGVEVSAAVGTFYFFTEKYLITVLPHLTPWHLTVTCVGVNLLALFILGIGIHWIKDQLSPLLKKHSWKIKVVSEDLIKACAVGCLTRIAKSVYTHENPSFSYKGIGPISLEVAAITITVLFIFMNMQQTGNYLYEHNEIPTTEEISNPPNEQPSVAPNTQNEINNLKKIVTNQHEQILQLTQQNERLQDENSRLTSERDQQAENQSKELTNGQLYKQAQDFNKLLETEIAQLKQEITDLKSKLERQESNGAQKLKELTALHMVNWERTSREAEQLTKSFTFMDKESPLKTLQEDFRKLRARFEEQYSELRGMLYSRLHYILENQELRKQAKELKTKLIEKSK